MSPPLVFIGGHRKSGTSLLLNLLDGHADLAVYPTDAAYFYAYFPAYLQKTFSAQQQSARFERVVFTELEFWLRKHALEGLLDVSKLRDGFLKRLDNRFGDMAAITQAMAEAYTAVAGEDKPFVLKETSIEIYASELFAWHPDAKFIHILRDPRDNYAALKAGVETHYAKLGEGNLETLASLLNRARLGFLYAATNLRTFGADRYHVLAFEDLVANPDAALQGICAFLGIPFTASMRTPTKLGKPTRGNNFDAVDFSALSTHHVGAWPARISREEAQIIEFHLADVMQTAGYAPAFSPQEQAAAASDFYKWQNYRYFFKDRFRETSAPG